MSSLPTAPIFIIGSGRSGTTLLRLMIDSHPRISCGEETHFLRHLESIVGQDWPLLETYGFPRDYWIGRIRDLYAGFQADYLERRGKQRWAEKDPLYTLRLPFIGELFPEAQFVHLIRDGHDVVASHRERWGYRSGVVAAKGQWARFVRAGRDFGQQLPADRYHEVRYEALVGSPEPTARALLDFLGESWDDGVLTFDQADHDATDRYTGFTAERRRQGGETSAIYRSRVGAGRSRLDPLLRTLLQRSSGSLLRELGYQ